MTKRATVATAAEIQDGDMRQVKVGDTDVLLTRVNGTFYAMGAHCTHYGAPLAKGALKGDRVVCPWHNSCYQVTTGNQLQPPGLDDLPRFQVWVEDGAVIVEVPDDAPQEVVPPMAAHNPEADPRTFAILGAGIAGANAAETLRKIGFKGRIVLITAETDLPYDRTMLSKKYLAGKASEDALPLRPPEFYPQHDIETLTAHPAKAVDPDSKTITFADGSTMAYDALLLATGGAVRQLDIPGMDLPRVFTLRSDQDSMAIAQAAESVNRAVIVGSSFIGMETASSLTQRGVQVTVVSPESVPFEKTLGPDVGKLFQSVHEANGVVFKLGSRAKAFEGNGSLNSVVLENGERWPADMAIVGVGVTPATGYLQGVELAGDRSIPTDEYLQVTDGIYAAGDIAQFPFWMMDGEPTRIEHWQLAAQHGRVAAHNMVGQSVPFRGVPYFWTGQFDLKLRYIGHVEDWDEIVVDGDISEKTFLAFYVKGDRILAVAGCNRDSDIAAISELMRLDRMPAVAQIQSSSLDWGAQLQAA
ncbi:MAG: FAD-dependent oxidoreductase [Synechococcales bacterium]|nr:FAD-dependent oxidoreductase [Synechococcales bacterium]